MIMHWSSRNSDESDEAPVEETKDVFEDDEVFSDKSSVKTDTSSINGKDDLDLDFLPPRKKRKYQKHLPPPTMIQTRGARRPKFSFERRTHRKIMVSSPAVKSPPSVPKPKRPAEIPPPTQPVSHVQHMLPANDASSEYKVIIISTSP